MGVEELQRKIVRIPIVMWNNGLFPSVLILASHEVPAGSGAKGTP